MRKINYVILVLLLLVSCSKVDLEMTPLEEDDLVIAPTERLCDADNIMMQQLATDPEFRDNQIDLEAFTRNYQEEVRRGIRLQSSVTIPVVVNVLYKTSAENVSLAQIQTQIDVLNKDFNAQNTDFSLVPSDFTGVKANVGITFVLQNVVRKSTNKKSWRTNDDMKKAAKGGISPTSPQNTLNIWVCTLSGGILGYAQFPGGNSATDGVVILNTGFGTNGTAAAPFNLGRTATHEVGHWANLRHIWGDASCGNDQVGDTPPHNTANYGCPTQPHMSTCSGSPREMTMNYMDYTNDNCMFMFSNGQKTRMLAVFAAGASRASFGN